jgi:hypothetical protein
MCASTIRVAIRDTGDGELPVIVKRLKTDEPLPTGTIEGMLVLTGETALGRVRESRLPVAYRAIEIWARRCMTAINQHGRTALRRLGTTAVRLLSRGRNRTAPVSGQLPP